MLKVLKVEPKDLDEIIELETLDKAFYDADIERKVVKFYSWDRKKFLERLSQNNVKAFQCVDSVKGRAIGFAVVETDNGTASILNLVGKTDEALQELTEYTERYYKAKALTYVVPEDSLRQLQFMHKHCGDLVKPKLLKGEFGDECDGISYRLPAATTVS